MLLLATEPLRRVSSFLEERSQDSPSVAVRLSEPFWSGLTHVQLLVHCVQLHTLLERETLDASKAPRDLAAVCANSPRVAELIGEIDSEIGTLHPGAPSPMPLLDETALSSMCPLVGHYLGDPDTVYRTDDVPAVREYLEHVAALNQLLTIASQLRADVLAERHKYAAHKIALLYHAINSSKLAREVPLSLPLDQSRATAPLLGCRRSARLRTARRHPRCRRPPGAMLQRPLVAHGPGQSSSSTAGSTAAPAPAPAPTASHTRPARAQVLRKRIEEHFEDVKEATESQEAPALPPALAEWIVGLCDQARRPAAAAAPAACLRLVRPLSCARRGRP